MATVQNLVDTPGATGPNLKNTRKTDDGCKGNYTEYVIANDKGSIHLGATDKNAAVTSGISLKTPDGEHGIQLEIDGPRKGWTTSICPGNFNVECGSANEEAQDTIMVEAKNGNINIVATKGKIRLQGTDIELVAVGSGDDKGNIKLTASKNIITQSQKLLMNAEAYYRIATPGIGEVVANAVLQMYGSIFRGVSDGCAYKNAKTGGQGFLITQTVLAAKSLSKETGEEA